MSKKPWSVWLGFDLREAAAFAVARQSILRYHRHTLIEGLVLSDLQARGLYTRPTEMRLGKLWDTISAAHMSTEFAISRFLVPELVRREECLPNGWALFMDCDVMVRASLSPLFESLDDAKPLYCVKHDYQPGRLTKMDGQAQRNYPRKNWSSVMAFNCDHPANKALTVEMVNTMPGRDLHRFCWLDDEDIGELSPVWNYLVGHTKLDEPPKIVHFTEGGPWLPAFRNVEYADEWLAQVERWAA